MYVDEIGPKVFDLLFSEDVVGGDSEDARIGRARSTG